MLQFVLGRAGSGKTTWVHTRILERAKQGKRSVLLVPEQFASTADLSGYTLLGDEYHTFLKVCSFRTLTGQIEARYGGGALKDMTDAGRMVLVRRALTELGEKIVYFNRPRRSMRFCADCADTLQQLKYCGVDASLLAELAGSKGEKGRRLVELGLIFQKYEDLRSKTELEAVDRLSRAAERVGDEFFADTAYFVDAFGEFTAPETAILRRAICSAEAVYITLCCPDEQLADTAFTQFSPAADTARHLMQLADGCNVSMAEPVVLHDEHRFLAPGLAGVEHFLSNIPARGTDVDGVRCFGADGIYEEALYVAARIARLAREGAPYESMVVVCRDPKAYLPALRYSFGLYGLPLFTGSTVSAEYAPLCIFFRAALGLAKNGLNSESLLALLKTGLCGVSEEQLSALENYVYTWQPKADDWRAEFERNPAGPDASLMEEEEQRLLDWANLARQKIVEPADTFCKMRGKTGSTLSKALYTLLQNVGAAAVVSAWIAQEAGQSLGSFDSTRMWETGIGFLDEMAALLGEEEIRAEEYDELLCVLMRSTEIGQAPHTQNEVQLAAADSMRLDNPDHVFVMGLNEDVFPAPVGDNPLLTNDDRAALSERGAPLSGNFENMVLREEMNLYRALTGARRSLTMTWLDKKDGSAQVVSSRVDALCRALNLKKDTPTTVDFALTPQAAMEVLARHYREDSADTAALRAALRTLPEMAGRLDTLESITKNKDFSFKDADIVKELLGTNLTISPTRMESFYSCRFAYFLHYELGIQPRSRAELGMPQSGTLVHWLLETLLQDIPALDALDEDALTALVDARIHTWIAEKMPDNSSVRFAYLTSRICENVVRLLRYIRDEQAQGGFVPCAFEENIGAPNGVPALVLQGSHGQSVRVVGQVDRIDVMKRDGISYLRVVDYKTGSKEFFLDEVFNGLNTQMLLYLFILAQNGKEKFGENVPAGVLYLISDPSPSADEKKSQYAVDGIVLDDPAVLQGMDETLSGRYLPFKPSAKGKINSDKLVDMAMLGHISQRLQQLIVEMTNEMYEGIIAARPLRHHNKISCTYCDYRPVCRHRDGENEGCLQKVGFASEQEEKQ